MAKVKYSFLKFAQLASVRSRYESIQISYLNWNKLDAYGVTVSIENLFRYLFGMQKCLV